jgi:SAM-dependent methyltransferase
MSGSMLQRARAKVAARSLPIDLVDGDAQKLPFPDSQFDAAISECTLCLLDKNLAVAEMARVVKPGGYVGMHDICWQDDTPERLKHELARIEGERPETLEGWKSLFEAAGLTDVQTLDRSSLIPDWARNLRKKLGVLGQLKIFLRVLQRWGINGLSDVLESERIMGGPHTGYGLVVGRKPSVAGSP